MHFNLQNHDDWEFVLIDNRHSDPKPKSSNKKDNENTNTNEIDSNNNNDNNNNDETNQIENNDNDNDNDNDNENNNNQNNQENTKTNNANSLFLQSNPKEILTLPPPWVSLLRLSVNQIDYPFPRGYTKKFFHKCTVERWSRYYPDMRGLTLKISMFNDNERLIISETREIFEDRKFCVCFVFKQITCV